MFRPNIFRFSFFSLAIGRSPAGPSENNPFCHLSKATHPTKAALFLAMGPFQQGEEPWRCHTDAHTIHEEAEAGELGPLDRLFGWNRFKWKMVPFCSKNLSKVWHRGRVEKLDPS